MTRFPGRQIPVFSALAIVVASAPSIGFQGFGGAQLQRGSIEGRIEQLAGVTVEEVKALLNLLKESVGAGDRKAVCALATYPLRIADRDVPSLTRCVSEYASIFNREVLTAVTKQRFEDLFVNWQGIMIGDGDLWLAGVCRDKVCQEYDFRITRVNSNAPLHAAADGVRLRDVLSGPLASPRWVMLPGRPAATDIACSNSSALFWSTSVRDGAPHATRTDLRERFDPLPFPVARARDREGNRWVVAVADGWIVGFNQGEFGGGLWWFNRTGSASRRIRPSPGGPANAGGGNGAENVVGLPSIGGEQIVLMGLDHLGGREGRILRLVQGKDRWTLATVAVLDSSPDVWFVDGNRLLILTDSGLWSWEPGGAMSQIHRSDIGELAPSAIVRAPDGGIYVGLRQYVVKLEQSDGRWREAWFAPSACLRLEIRDATCECAG